MSRVVVRRVEPVNLHGFGAGQLRLEGLTDGLNLVYASNASGKSTLAKAILNLFSPTDLESDSTVVGLVFDGKTHQSLTARRKQKEFAGFAGRTADYSLDLKSLLEGFKKGDPVLEKELANGIALLPNTASGTRSATVEVNNALNHLTELKRGRRVKAATAREEEEVPELAAKLEEAELARSISEALETLKNSILLGQEKRRLSTELAQLEKGNPGLAKQTSESVELVKQMLQSRQARRLSMEKLQAQLARLAPGALMPEKPLLEADKVRLDDLHEEITRLGGLVAHSRRELVAAHDAATSRRNAILQLSPDEELEELPDLTEEQFLQLTQFASEADRIRVDRLRREAFEDALEQWISDREGPTGSLDLVERRLLEWIEFEPEEEAGQWWLPILVAGVFALGANLVPILVGRIVVAVVGFGAAGWLAWKATQGQLTGDRPSLSDLPAPFNSSNPATARVAELLKLVALARSEVAVENRLRIRARERIEEFDWREIQESLDLKCSDPLRLGLVADGAMRYLEAKRRVEDSTADIEADEVVRDEKLAEVIRLYRDYGYPCPSGKELAAIPAFLSWFACAEEIEISQKEIESSEAEIKEFLSAQGVPSDPSLETRISVLANRRAIASQRLEILGELRNIESQLAAHRVDEARLGPLFPISDLGQASLIEIDAEIGRQDALSRELETRRKTLDDVRVRIRLAEEEASIEQQEIRFRSALSKVESRYGQLGRSAIATRVSSVIRERLMKEDLPILLIRANERLNDFTHGRYRLELASDSREGLSSLLVYDREDGKSQQFGELSTGTKVHTVIALRLALIDEQEKGDLKFPLLADEAMAVSDPESSEAIARTLALVAKERQVIVFTSQAADVALLRRVDPDCSLHGLNGIPPDIPESEILELNRTRRAPVTQVFDPRVPVGAHSLGAIFGDAEGDLGERVDRAALDPESLRFVGLLEKLRTNLSSSHPRLDWSACAEEAWATGAAETTLRELLESACGCPHRFLASAESLRGKSFNSNQYQKLSDFLEEGGYLASPPDQQHLVMTVHREMGGKVPLLRSQLALVLLGEAFIPAFDPATVVGRLATVDPVPRRRKVPDPSTPALFEELAG